MIKIWIERGLISPKEFDRLQEIMDCIYVPPSVGRIPSKIASSFSSFTADQLKNWTTLYSLIVLVKYLPKEDLECWRRFVLDARLLSQECITLHDIQLADALLLYFCSRVQRMYGTSAITPNMHLHCHLRECFLDYGPVYIQLLAFFIRKI